MGPRLPSLSNCPLGLPPTHDQLRPWAVHMHSASCQSGPRALSKQSFRKLGEGTLAPSQGFAGRSWRGSGKERKRLHYRQTEDNSGNSQKPQHKPRRKPE